MKLRDIIGLIIALILAIGVALLTRIFLTQNDKAPQQASPKENQLTKILVAVKNLPEGDKVKAGDLKWQEWPQESVNSSYIAEGTVKIEDYVGAVVRFPVSQGEPIVAHDLVKPGERSILSAVVAPGKRAISIEVTASTASSGLIAPGDYVDVILSTMITEQTQQQGKCDTILSNVKVVAIDTALSAPEDKPKDAPKVATLEVSPSQAEILMAGAKEGTLSLSLYSLEKSGASSEIPPLIKPIQQREVIIMRGNDKSTIEF